MFLLIPFLPFLSHLEIFVDFLAIDPDEEELGDLLTVVRYGGIGLLIVIHYSLDLRKENYVT